MSMHSFPHEKDNMQKEVGAASSTQLVTGEARNDGGGGTWVVTSTKEDPSRSGKRASSRKNGTGNSKTSGTGDGKGKCRQSFSYLLLCSKCKRPAEKGNMRIRLCGDRHSCKRWVHRQEFKRFNEGLPHKCCQHHKEIQPVCECNTCKTRRCKEEGALSSALSSPGTATPLETSPSLQVEEVREEGMEVTNEEMGGEGAGATPLAMNLMVDVEGVVEEEMLVEVTSGGVGGEGAERREIPPRMTPPPTTKPKTAVFILWDYSEAMKTMSICLDNSGNRVVTRVDMGTKLSSCSREPCQQLSHAASGRRQIGDDAGVPSGIDGRCKHAKAAFHALEQKTALQASLVTFGGKNIRDVITEVANKKGMSGNERVHLENLVEVAQDHGIPPLLKMGNTGYYAVYDGTSRSVEHNWAHVKHINPKQTTESKDDAWRRLKTGERLGCKAIKGYPCSDFKSNFPKKCRHTQMVAAAMWAAIGHEGERSDDFTTAPEGLQPGEEEVDENEAVTGDAAEHHYRSRRTADSYIKEDPTYQHRLWNTLHLMAIYKFPPRLPGSLPPNPCGQSEGGTMKFETSQRRCSRCKLVLPPSNAKCRGKLVGMGPLLVSVNVVRRRCKECNIKPRASDDWRSTGVFNYNDSLLVELRLLYLCREAFVRGVSITTFFQGHLASLSSDSRWAKEHPGLAKKLDPRSDLFNSLKDAYLAFEALTDHPFEYRCWLWGKYPQIVTYDACMELSTNYVTPEQAKASRPKMGIDVDLMTVLLQLSILSPIFFGGVRVQFVVGAGETVGSSPAWVAPGNRLSEFFLKSARGGGPETGSTGEKIAIEDGNGAALLEELHLKEVGIGDINRFKVPELKRLFKTCFPEGSSTLSRKEQYVDLLTRLHEFWISDHTPQRGSCVKLFVGRGSYASAGVMGGYVPSGVMVSHKVLVTPESPQDVADAVLACKVPPDLVVYDIPCQLWRHIESGKKGLLQGEGQLPRLPASAPEVSHECEQSASGASTTSGGSADFASTGRVYLPALKHLGNHGSSVSYDGTIGTSLPVDTRPEGGSLDVYALKEASLPSSCPQSQLDLHELLFEAGHNCGEVGELSFLAATRSLSTLHQSGNRILSLYEVLVFTYEWHRDILDRGYSHLVLAREGWRVQVLGSDSSPPPPDSVGGGSNSTPAVTSTSVVSGSGEADTDPDNAGPQVVGVEDALHFLKGLLVVAVGSRNGKPPCLPSVVFQMVPSQPFSYDMIIGLRRYAEAKEGFLVQGLQPRGRNKKCRAEEMVRAGIGLWWNVSSVKALQIALNPEVVPHESGAVENKVEGYDVVFRDTSNDDYSCVINGARRPHPYTGVACGMFLGPGGPHESNHNDMCRQKYAGLSSCVEIAGLNLNPHEQNRARKATHLQSLTTMTFPNFTYSLRVLNELQNEEYNRKTLMNLLRSMAGHLEGCEYTCGTLLLKCGRCFCSNPVMRVFDRFGRVDIVPFSSVPKG